MPLSRIPTKEAEASAKAMGCAFVMLGHRRFALIDVDVLQNISKWNWHYNKRGYAARLQYRGPLKCDAIIYLHRVIMGDFMGVQYDHVNRNKLDCRKENLRRATQHQNSGNAGKRNQKKPATSKFKGVCFDNGKQRWLAQGRNFGRMVFLGRFHDEVKAAQAYNVWASKHFGEFAFLNPV